MENSNIETFAYTIKRIQTVDFLYTDITEKEFGNFNDRTRVVKD
jgi:hypothetical protein